MSSALDVIELPGQPGHYGRRVLVDAWQAAGSPPVNSAGRLYGEQKQAWDAYLDGTGSPADNPDDETQRLAHVRFVAADIDPTPDRVRRLAAAGLIRPYSYEPWHWELPNVREYALVRSIPLTIRRRHLEETMIVHIIGKDGVREAGLWLITTDAKTGKRSGTYMGAGKESTGFPKLIDPDAVRALSKAVHGLPD